MSKKDVLREGHYSHQYSGIKSTTCSGAFIRSIIHDTASKVTCEACGRVHFDASEETSLSQRALAGLKRSAKNDPDRYREHLSAIPWTPIPFWGYKGKSRKWAMCGSHVTVLICPCGKGARYEYETKEPPKGHTLPEYEIEWNDAGDHLIADIIVTLPDGHICVRRYTADLISIEKRWGKQPYADYYLVNIEPPYKKVERIEVGLDPTEATQCFISQLLKNAAWSFASRTYNKHTDLKLHSFEMGGTDTHYKTRKWTGPKTTVITARKLGLNPRKEGWELSLFEMLKQLRELEQSAQPAPDSSLDHLD